MWHVTMIQVHGECIDQLNYRSPSPLSFRVVTGGDSRLQGSEDQQYDHLLEERPGVPCHHTLPQTGPPVSDCGSLVLLWPVVKKKGVSRQNTCTHAFQLAVTICWAAENERTHNIIWCSGKYVHVRDVRVSDEWCARAVG